MWQVSDKIQPPALPGNTAATLHWVSHKSWLHTGQHHAKFELEGVFFFFFKETANTEVSPQNWGKQIKAYSFLSKIYKNYPPPPANEQSYHWAWEKKSTIKSKCTTLKLLGTSAERSTEQSFTSNSTAAAADLGKGVGGGGVNGRGQEEEGELLLAS